VCNWSSATSFSWNEYDLVAFNEIWEIKEFENLIVDNFEIKTKKCRQTTRGGGVVIFGKLDIKTETLETPFIEGTFESVGVRVGEVIFVNIYRPPSGNKDEFVEILSNFLDSVRGSKVLIGGDYNLDILGGNRWIESICNLYNLAHKINNVTRIESGTCIDNFLTNMEGTFKVSNISIADHLAIVAKVDTNIAKIQHKDSYEYRQMKEENWLIFKQGLCTIQVNGSNLNEKWSNLLADLKEIVERSFPLKTSRKNYSFAMSQGLLKSRDRKNKLLRDYKSGKIRKEIYIEYNKVYRKLIKTEQCKKFKDKMKEAGNSGKKKWKVLKESLLLEKEKVRIEEIKANGISLKSDVEIAEAFKNHFKNCASELTRGLPQGEDTSVLVPQGEPWSFLKTNRVELIKIIKSLQNKNSSGFDNLSNRMLKREPHLFADILCPLINSSLDEGFFPDCLKIANVIPIYKKGDKTNLNNYRPISLLPVVSKVFEKVINNQLNSLVEEKFIDSNQFGFRLGYNTEDAVVKFVDKIENDLAKNLHVVTVYVDVSKAFDSCDHSILINKIKRTGLDNLGVKLIESYLKDRTQLVIVNNKEGGTFVINIGVGQGTILGPTFFKIYIMDLHLATNLFCVKFADDSSFEGSGKSRDEVEALVNMEMKKISKWFKKNRLKLHPDKSRMIIHSRDKLIRIKLDECEIQRCGYGLQEESVKLLGIHIDENLDWKIHIKSVVKKISKGNYLLWRYSNHLSKNMKQIIYESFVRCHLTYGLVAWGGANDTAKKPLIVTLRKIWKKIGKRLMHTLPRLQKYNLLKLEDEIKLQEFKMLWRWNAKKLPESLLDIIVERQDRLRGRRFNIPIHLKNNAISTRLTKRANTSMIDIANHRSKKKLATHIKKSSLDQYSFTCNNRNCFICLNG